LPGFTTPADLPNSIGRLKDDISSQREKARASFRASAKVVDAATQS
jgi:hypothetical protein